MSSCANIIQQLLKDSGIDFFDKTQQWPGNSLDVNEAEHLGVILKGLVEHLMLQEHSSNRYSHRVFSFNKRKLSSKSFNMTHMQFISNKCLYHTS